MNKTKWETKKRRFFRGQIHHVSKCGKKDCKEGVHIFDDTDNAWNLKDLEDVFIKEFFKTKDSLLQELMVEVEEMKAKTELDIPDPKEGRFYKCNVYSFNKALDNVFSLIKSKRRG